MIPLCEVCGIGIRSVVVYEYNCDKYTGTYTVWYTLRYQYTTMYPTPEDMVDPAHNNFVEPSDIESKQGNNVMFNDIDINSAPKKDIIQNLQILLDCVMPSLDHSILNTHVEFCKVSIVFLSFVHWYRMHFDTSVKLRPDEFRKRMQTMTKTHGENEGWKETLLEFLGKLTYDKFGRNSPNDINKPLKITRSSTKWTSTVSEKTKLPPWKTELEYKSYVGTRKGLYFRHKEFLQSIGFK